MVRLRRVETASVVGPLVSCALGAGSEIAPPAECVLRFDFDGDGDLDLFDVGALQSCFGGSIGSPAFVAPSAECLLRFDFDGDGDVDLSGPRSVFGGVRRSLRSVERS